MADKINPSHYKPTGSAKLLERVIRLRDLQAIDVIEVFNLGPHLASTAKYILRAGKKSEQGYDDAFKEIEDLGKSIWYTLRYIQNVAEEHDIQVSGKMQQMLDLMLPPRLDLSKGESE